MRTRIGTVRGTERDFGTRLLRYGDEYGLDHLVCLGLVPGRDEPDLWDPLPQALVLPVEPADLHFLRTGRAEQLVRPARASRRMHLSEASERLAQNMYSSRAARRSLWRMPPAHLKLP